LSLHGVWSSHASFRLQKKTFSQLTKPESSMNVSLTVFPLKIDLNGIAWTWHVSPEMKS